MGPRWKEAWQRPWEGVNGTHGFCEAEWSWKAGNREDMCIRGRRSSNICSEKERRLRQIV